MKINEKLTKNSDTVLITEQLEVDINHENQSITDDANRMENALIESYRCEIREIIQKYEDQILVISRDGIDTSRLRNILGKLGIKVDESYVFNDSTQLNIKKGIYSAVILDDQLSMSEIIKEIQYIRELYSKYEMPIIISISGYNENWINMMYSYGVNDILHKPYNSNEVISRIKTYLFLKGAIHQAVEKEMSFLQAQIDPHFIFNVLNSISTLCILNGEYASELVDEFSSYLRFIFKGSSRKETITLAEELKLIDIYYKIEKIRFSERISLTVNVDVDTEIPIIPLIIEPLVENAFRHGQKKIDEILNVYLNITENDGLITVQVEDDGKGMDAKKVNDLLSGDKLNTDGIGLSNLMLRLKRYYITDLNIESSPGVGTKMWYSIEIKT